MSIPGMFRHRILVVVFFLLCCTGSGAAQESLVKTYPVIDSVTRYTVAQQNLTVLCKKRIAERHITLVGAKGSDEVLLVAVTLTPIENVTTDISLIVEFEGMVPKPGKVETWCYVFDRNKDGVIDYLAMLGGAAPFWNKDIPADFPERGLSMSREQLELLVNRSGLIFNHWADDNFDGKLDGVIHADMFFERDWVRRRLIVRSPAFNDSFDEISSFLKIPGDIEDSIDVYEDGVAFYPIGKQEPDVIGKKMFEEKNSILKLINQAVAACKLETKLRGIPQKETE